jgi:hypothetical protein
LLNPTIILLSLMEPPEPLKHQQVPESQQALQHWRRPELGSPQQVPPFVLAQEPLVEMFQQACF